MPQSFLGTPALDFTKHVELQVHISHMMHTYILVTYTYRLIMMTYTYILIIYTYTPYHHHSWALLFLSCRYTHHT